MEKRKQYAIGQHDLCCEHLGIGNSHEDNCDTLFEAVIALQDDIAKLKERAAGLETLAGELIAMFRVNALHGNINLKDAELDAHLAPWIERLTKLKK
jgi:hypothetical protein